VSYRLRQMPLVSAVAGFFAAQSRAGVLFNFSNFSARQKEICGA